MSESSIINAKVTEIANSGLRGAVYSLGQDDRGRLWAGGREGVFYFDRGRFVLVPGVPGGNISPSPGMDTERFGSATSTRAFSIRRQRVSSSAFLGPDSDTNKGR